MGSTGPSATTFTPVGSSCCVRGSGELVSVPWCDDVAARLPRTLRCWLLPDGVSPLRRAFRFPGEARPLAARFLGCPDPYGARVPARTAGKPHVRQHGEMPAVRSRHDRCCKGA
jgi:hypothetical protein